MAGDLRDLQVETDFQEDNHPQQDDKKSTDDISILVRRSTESLPVSLGAFQKILFTTCLAAALAALCVVGGDAVRHMRARVTATPEEKMLAPEKALEDLLPVFPEDLTFQVASKEEEEPFAPPPQAPEPPAEERLLPEAAPAHPLVNRLREPMFEKQRRITDIELHRIRRNLEGDDSDALQILDFFYMKDFLRTLYPDRMTDISVLDAYSSRIRKHITNRAKAGLQEPVAILSPSTFLRPWTSFFLEKQKPQVSQTLVERCRGAVKVLFALPYPLGDPSRTYTSATGHFFLVVIDRETMVYSVVDSWPRPPKGYALATEFIGHIAESLGDINGNTSAKFTPSKNMPEPGFPLQAEGETRRLATTAGVYNACGIFAMENLLCIAEGRRPNYKAEDTQHIRHRMALELIEGLWDRELLNGEVRRAMNEE